MTEDWREKALRHAANVNSGGLGAKMPHAEMIVAANALTAEGLMEWRDGFRWLTPAGHAALAPSPPDHPPH